MKSFLKSWALAAILTAALTSALAPRAAAQTGSIGGTILDVNGNPWPEVVIRSVSDQGAKQETKTDSALVAYAANDNLRPGIPIRSEEHTSELQSHSDLVCRLLLEKKNDDDERKLTA